jgi:hypothetical protein
MAFTIRSVEYYYANVRDELAAAYRVLSQLAELGVNLLAFTAVPSGPSLAQFALFPADPKKLVAEGARPAFHSTARITRSSSKATTSSVRSRVFTNGSPGPAWTSTPPRA